MTAATPHDPAGTAEPTDMAETALPEIVAAEIVLPGRPIDETLEFFTGRLGFRVAAIFPADEPSVVVVTGHGLRIRLDDAAQGDPGLLRLACASPSEEIELRAPNGTRLRFADVDPPIHVPPLRPSLVVTRVGDGAPWHAGRAGLFYRDLIPDRLGGRFIASHIRLADGGPVADYVHFHKIGFQMIFCHRGWVKVVYEDQGEPFVMHEGDCVLQPPRIRHRVLESSAGMQVVELACPALHETLADPAMKLPNGRLDAERDFSGQRFVRHVARDAGWLPWQAAQSAGFEAQDLGIGQATAGAAGARLIRPTAAGARTGTLQHDAELRFFFVCEGAMTLQAGSEHRLSEGDCCAVPAALAHAIGDCSPDLRLLEVTVPASSSAGGGAGAS